MQEWIYDYLKEMVEKLGMELNDDTSDIITDYSNSIVDGVTEGYYCSGEYVADCNLKESRLSNENNKIKSLQNELDALYIAIRIKGYSFYFKNNQIYETGMEHIGGTVSASYNRIVK